MESLQPVTPRDFLRIAEQRLSAAEDIATKLLLTLEAQYIAGYSVECSMKALILEITPLADRPDLLKKITQGAQSHRPEVLLGILRDRGVTYPLALVKRMRRFDWTTDLRYETGRKDTSETNGLLKTARAVYNWASGQIV